MVAEVIPPPVDARNEIVDLAAQAAMMELPQPVQIGVQVDPVIEA